VGGKKKKKNFKSKPDTNRNEEAPRSGGHQHQATRSFDKKKARLIQKVRGEDKVHQAGDRKKKKRKSSVGVSGRASWGDAGEKKEKVPIDQSPNLKMGEISKEKEMV